MHIIKFRHKNGKVKFAAIVKVASVKFDSRPGWILVRDVHVAPHFADVSWIHPADTHVDWIRDFS